MPTGAGMIREIFETISVEIGAAGDIKTGIRTHGEHHRFGGTPTLDLVSFRSKIRKESTNAALRLN